MTGTQRQIEGGRQTERERERLRERERESERKRDLPVARNYQRAYRHHADPL